MAVQPSDSPNPLELLAVFMTLITLSMELGLQLWWLPMEALHASVVIIFSVNKYLTFNKIEAINYNFIGKSDQL